MARKRVSENPIILSGASPAPARRKPSTTNRSVRAAAAEETTAPEEVQAVAIPVEPVAEVLSSETPAVPTYQEIAGLAYSYWVARGHQGGAPEEDWLRAERELSRK
jgi:hypothetical protein